MVGKWTKHDFLGRSIEKKIRFREQGNIWKGSPVFPGMFETVIRVPFLQGRLLYQFQVFAAVFGKRERYWFVKW